MISFVLLLLIGGCFATPIQQEGRQFRDEVRNSDGTVVGKYGFQDPSGGIRIVQYRAGKEGINTQNDGSSPLPQPIIWNQDQPIIVEPAPLTYGSVKGSSVLTERDQQRHLNIDEEMDSREEVSAEETKPESEVNLDSRDVIKVEDNQRPVQTETAALLGSSILPMKGGVKQIVSLDNEQVFPQVVSGQRRLIETQPQQYSVKGKSLNTISGASPSVDNVGYQALHYGIPINIEEHRVTSQGVKRPVVQYQLQPQNQVNQEVVREVTREVVRRPTYQVVEQSVKGVPRQVHYVIQPIVPSSINLVNRQQSLNKAQVLSQSDRQIDRQTQDESIINREVDLRPIQLGQGAGQVLKSEDLLQKQGVKTLVQHSNQKVRDETVRHVPVISGQRVVGYQLVSTQPQTQQQTLVPSDQSLVSNQQIVYTQNGQQYVPYVVQQQIPQTDVQQYYQMHQSIPVQSYGQQDDNQFNPYISQLIPSAQPIQYSESNLPRLEQPVRTVSQSQNHGLQGVQQIHTVQTDRVVNRGQDLRVNPLSVSQRSTVVTGVKGAVNV